MIGLSTIPKYSAAEIAALQRADPAVGVIIQSCESRESIPASADCPELQLMLKDMSRFEMKDSLLYRKRQCDNETVYQLVLPQALRKPVLYSLHDEMGHLGTEKTLELTRSRFYWPKMSLDVESKIKSCPRCIRRKSQPEKSCTLGEHTDQSPHGTCLYGLFVH